MSWMFEDLQEVSEALVGFWYAGANDGQWGHKMATHSSILAWKSHGQRSLAGYSPWRCKELDRPEWLTHTQEHKRTWRVGQKPQPQRTLLINQEKKLIAWKWEEMQPTEKRKMRDHKKNKLRLYFLSSPNILNIDYLLKIVMDCSCTVSGVSWNLRRFTAKHLTFGI